MRGSLFPVVSCYLAANDIDQLHAYCREARGRYKGTYVVLLLLLDVEVVVRRHARVLVPCVQVTFAATQHQLLTEVRLRGFEPLHRMLQPTYKELVGIYFQKAYLQIRIQKHIIRSPRRS